MAETLLLRLRLADPSVSTLTVHQSDFQVWDREIILQSLHDYYEKDMELLLQDILGNITDGVWSDDVTSWGHCDDISSCINNICGAAVRAVIPAVLCLLSFPLSIFSETFPDSFAIGFGSRCFFVFLTSFH